LPSPSFVSVTSRVDMPPTGTVPKSTRRGAASAVGSTTSAPETPGGLSQASHAQAGSAVKVSLSKTRASPHATRSSVAMALTPITQNGPSP
jgi:hypothetical protein